jgi:hypothetical protein
MSQHETKPIKLFFCYVSEDEKIFRRFEKHLSPLKLSHVIAQDPDLTLQAEEKLTSLIPLEKYFVESTNILLLFVSSDFLASQFASFLADLHSINSSEYKNHSLTVIPIIVRPAYWNASPFGKLQALPRNGKPITQWRNRDEAFAQITREILSMINPLFYFRINEELKRIFSASIECHCIFVYCRFREHEVPVGAGAQSLLGYKLRILEHCSQKLIYAKLSA